MNDDPTSDTVPAAELRSRTAVYWRPMTGTTSMGAKKGEERSDWALRNSAWAWARSRLDWRRGQISGREIGLHLLQSRQTGLVVPVGGQCLQAHDQRPDPNDRYDSQGDQPPASPSTPLLAHRDHSIFQATVSESMGLAGLNGATDNGLRWYRNRPPNLRHQRPWRGLKGRGR